MPTFQSEHPALNRFQWLEKPTTTEDSEEHRGFEIQKKLLCDISVALRGIYIPPRPQSVNICPEVSR